MNLLTDVFFLDNLKVIEESKKSGTMTIEGTFQRAESPNNNKRVYPRSVLTNQVERLQELVVARRLCGELDHPTNETVKLSNASHLITKLWMEGNEVFGRAELLNTPAGKVAQTLVNDGVSVGISSRGLGTLSESANEGGYKTVNDDYKLVTFDLVADPSTKGAYPKLSESTEYFNDTSRKALREKTYVTLLKQELGQRFGDNNMNERRNTRTANGLPNSPKFKPAKMSKRARAANESREYSDEELMIVLENNIRRFIFENEDPQLAAQFVRDHKEELMEGFLSGLKKAAKRGAAGLAKRVIPGTAKAGAELRRAERQKVRGNRATPEQGGKPTMPNTGLRGKQTAEPEGGDRNQAARIDRKSGNRMADRAARKAAGEARKDADTDQTLSIAKKKTVGAAVSAGKFAMGKIKQGWKSAAAKVHGGVAGAREKVASKVLGGDQKLRSSSRDSEQAATDAAKAAGRSASSHKGIMKKNLRGGVNRERTDYTKKGGDFRAKDTDAGGAGPTGVIRGRKIKKVTRSGAKKGGETQGELPLGAGIGDSHDWNVEFDYQMMRLHENIQRFEG